jgi:hemoglobin-like flavoprotein
MRELLIKKNPEVETKFQSYPKEVKTKINHLRKLIIETATEIEDIEEIEETLKWGEPSYLAKKGSTIRIDWKSKTPHQYAMYFKCTSKLVPTFKEVYGDLFKYEKNRAILFELDEKVPAVALKECIGLALRYHSVKNQPRLGL